MLVFITYVKLQVFSKSCILIFLRIQNKRRLYQCMAKKLKKKREHYEQL